MNLSSIRNRRLVHSRQINRGRHQKIEEEISAKFQCFTPLIQSKAKKSAVQPILKNTENGTFIMKLSNESLEQSNKFMGSSMIDSFKKQIDLPEPEPRANKKNLTRSGLAKTCIFPDPSRPKTSKGIRKNLSCQNHIDKRKSTENQQLLCLKEKERKDVEILKQRKCPQSCNSMRKRAFTYDKQLNKGVDEEFLSLFAK